MGKGNVGRPPKAGERYPSGDLKPVKTPAASDLARTPISGALWQRMLANAEKVFGDARFGTELGRLGAIGQLTPSEVSTGFRVAGIYGRFEYYNSLTRSAASPHYIREFVAESQGADAIDFNPTDKQFREAQGTLYDREERERAASEAFRELQNVIAREFRAEVERLCVENEHVGFQGLIRARLGLAVIKKHFADKEAGRVKKARKIKKRMKLSIEPPQRPAKPNLNPFKDAFFKVQRRINPSIGDQALEQAWETLCAVKALDDFRREKSERANASAP